MIVLHRLGHEGGELSLNPDLIVTIEAHPDSVITLSTGTKMVVTETLEEITEAVREWRVGILAAALKLGR
jgi:flagellar protein FlbD